MSEGDSNDEKKEGEERSDSPSYGWRMERSKKSTGFLISRMWDGRDLAAAVRKLKARKVRRRAAGYVVPSAPAAVYIDVIKGREQR